MSSRSVLGLIALLLLAAPAAAHAATYDPLVLEMHLFLAPEGALTEPAPQAAALPFAAATPAGAAQPLRFALVAPVSFAPAAGVEVELSVRAEQPVVTGDGLEVALEPGGAAERVQLPAAMAPGDVATVSLTVQAAAAYPKGADIALLVRPLAPALPEGALSLLVGGERPSRLALHEMRVASPRDLELQERDLTTFLLGSETFSPRGAGVVVHTVVVGHGAVQPPASQGWSVNGTWVVLRGEEDGEDAKAHAFADRERRIAAAHAFTVNGVLARVHPGLGVVVPVASAPIRIACVAQCPPGGFTHTVVADGEPPATDRQSSLIPPPRDTRGIPVSEDAPEDKRTPVPALAALAALALAASRKR